MRRAWLFALLAACDSSGGTNEDAGIDRDATDATADSVPVDAAPRCDVTTPFGTPEPVSGVNVAGMNAYTAWQSSDGLRLYFTRGDPGGASQSLYLATRASPTAAFSAGDPITIDPGVTAPEQSPSLTADELRLYFVRNGVIRIATRPTKDEPFGGSLPLIDIGNGGGGVSSHVSSDGLSLQYALANNVNIATRTTVAQPFGAGAPVAELISGTDTEYSPVLSDDGLEILFLRLPAGLDSGVYRALRAAPSDAFGEPTLSEITGVREPNWLSADRCELIFSQPGVDGYTLQIARRSL